MTVWDSKIMKIHEISWFKEFECMGGECPRTCCRGWLIPLDSEDRVRFKEEVGLLGLRLFAATAGHTRDRMNRGSGECPFHNKKGLCSLQLEKGHDFLPWACRSFPRFYRNYGLFEERYLDLSCIAAARLFIKNSYNLQLIETEDEPVTGLCTTNNDPGYLEDVIRIRSGMIDMIGRVFSGENRSDDISDVRLAGALCDAMYSYSCQLQDAYAHGGDCGDLKDFPLYADEEVGKACDRYVSIKDHVPFPAGAYSFPLPLSVLGKFVDSALVYFGLKKSGPELYDLLHKAEDVLEDARRAPVYFTDSVGEICKKNDILLPVLGSYMSYYLYQYFPDVYETYSFRKTTALGIIHMNMIMLLALAADDLADVISMYNRKTFYNDTIEDDLYRIFEECSGNNSL